MTEERCRIGTVSLGLGISRQGVRKHLQVLEDAKIVKLVPAGRDVFVELNVEALEPCREYLERIEKRWDQRLLALKNFVENGESGTVP